MRCRYNKMYYICSVKKTPGCDPVLDERLSRAFRSDNQDGEIFVMKVSISFKIGRIKVSITLTA